MDKKATAKFLAKARGEEEVLTMKRQPAAMVSPTVLTIAGMKAKKLNDDDEDDDGFNPKKKVTFREPLKEVNGPNKPTKGGGGKHEEVMFHDNPPSYSTGLL